MKKIILLMAMVFSLSANEIICQMSTDRYLKSHKLLEFAYERKDVFQIKWHSNNAITSLERVMVECNLTDKQKEEAAQQRKVLITIQETIKKQ